LEALLVGAAYLLCGGVWQRATLYVLAATAPLEIYRTAVAKVDVSLFRLSLLMALVVLAVTTPKRLAIVRRWARHPLVLSYAGLVLVTLVALVVHPINTFLGEREAAQIAIGIVALAMTAELVRRESLERAAGALVVGSALPILAASWQAIGPRVAGTGALPLLDRLPAAQGLEITRQALSSFGPIGARAKGTFGDPDHFGVYLIFVVCAALALAVLATQRGNRRGQISFAAMASAASAALVATYSRSAWVGAVVGVLITSAGIVNLWRSGRLRAPSRPVAMAILLGAVAVSIAIAPSVVERIAPSSAINVVSNREHASTVRFAFDQFVDHPVLGIGPGGLGVKLKLPPRTSGASSTYLSVAAQVGIFGLLALLAAAAIVALISIGAYRALRGAPQQILILGLGGAYAGFAAANVTYDVWFDDFHWLILGAMAGLSAIVGSSDTTSQASANRGAECT
jgi:hypothetical protein